jgi:predicted DNA-binding transcriptional regulator YafY
VDGGYQLAPGAALPPLVLDDDEAVAVAASLRLAAAGAATEATARTLAKVTQVMPARLRRRAEAVAAMTESASWDPARAGQAVIDSDVLAGAAIACRDAERIRFSYVAASGERTERHVEPHRLVVLDQRWYLVGYDLARNDWRSFRLDRLDAPATTGARFRPRELPADDATAFVKAGIGRQPAPYTVRARVAAPAERVRARIGRWSEVEADGDGCLVTMRTDSLEWPAMALGTVGAEFTVLGPPEMADYLRDWSERFGRAVIG